MPCRDWEFDNNSCDHTDFHNQIKKLKDRNDELSALLCTVCHSLSENSEVFWNLDDSPTLVGKWWQKHQELDKKEIEKALAKAKRIEEEKKEAKKKALLKEKALNKSTSDEKKALGL